jgi:copper homeostasis protein
VREKIGIKLYPIIRPRSMNYFYDEDEWEIIRLDVRVCKDLGCDGVSVGVQKLNGEIDGTKMSRLVEWAYPMGVTCNRAFDAVPDPFAALEILIEAGCERILTSGLQSSAPEGAKLLAELVRQANGRISIMPGAGVRAANLKSLIEQTGAKEFHTSARKTMSNPMLFSNPLVTDAGSMVVADEAELQKILQILKSSPAL